MDDTDRNKLFVGGISWETTDEVLKEHFGNYGTVLGSVIAKDRITGSPRGFAFVSLSESSAVERALQDSHEILSRMVDVKKAIPRSEQQSQHGSNRNNTKINDRSHEQLIRTKKIFVGGLSANLTEQEFKSYFEKFGTITDVVVMHDSVTHKRRGFGFITFDSEDSVEDVIQNKFHHLTGKYVEVKKAIPKDGSNTTTNSTKSIKVYNGNFNSYQPGAYFPYNTGFGYYPSGYGNVAGYPYGAGYFSGGYPHGVYDGFGYGLSPFSPGRVPFGSVAPFYPTYVNGGYTVMGMNSNGYGGITGSGFAQLSYSGDNSVDADSFGSGRGAGTAAA